VKIGRWLEVTESQHPWEREALGYLRERLPDTEPFRAWSNFEFIAEDGSINEIDLLVVSLYKIYLVEIKSRPGRVRRDSGTWTWSHEGRDLVDDNPLLLANRKTKKFKSLLQRQGALRKHRIPYVEPVIFLSNQSLKCNLAPELMTPGAFDAAKLDIFSLGSIAYHLFSGEPPARSVEELHQKLSSGRGLRISDVLDGVAASIQELVEFATDPDVEDRPGSVGEFLQLLEAVEEELTAPEPEQTTHPLDARTGDHLEGGFVVKRRLGKGSTSVALLVERDGQEGVLKVALDAAQNPRLTKEGEVLKALRHQNIVELYEQHEINGHVVLFMAKAGADTKSGTYTLAERIREEGRLSLDLLQRFGDELLNVLGWLEAKGTSHRDIKPDNIGVAGTQADKALTLILFGQTGWSDSVYAPQRERHCRAGWRSIPKVCPPHVR
jgi:hypothetical protein